METTNVNDTFNILNVDGALIVNGQKIEDLIKQIIKEEKKENSTWVILKKGLKALIEKYKQKRN